MHACPAYPEMMNCAVFARIFYTQVEWEEKNSLASTFTTPRVRGHVRPLPKSWWMSSFSGLQSKGMGSAQWTFATQSSKFRSVEFERNDPMAIFEEEELVVDKGMTHM